MVKFLKNIFFDNLVEYQIPKKWHCVSVICTICSYQIEKIRWDSQEFAATLPINFKIDAIYFSENIGNKFRF